MWSLSLLCSVCDKPFEHDVLLRIPDFGDAEQLATSATFCAWKQIDGRWYCPEHVCLAIRTTLVEAV